MLVGWRTGICHRILVGWVSRTVVGGLVAGSLGRASLGIGAVFEVIDDVKMSLIF